MSNEERLKKINEDAVKRLRDYDDLPALTGPAEAGDQYYLKNQTGVTAVVLNTHPDDDNLLFVVPGDWLLDTLVGTADVPVPEGVEPGPLVLRCGLGNWVTREGLEKCVRHKVRVPLDYVRQARKLLAGLVRGEALPRGKDDDDPELWDWCEEIEADMADALATLDLIRPA